MLKEFKAFVMRGNVLDLAVAVIMGASFGAIVTSLVNDVLMPPIGLVLGKVDFKDLFFSLNGHPYPNLAAAKAAGAPTIAYGQFLNTIINFLIVAGVIFAVVRTANRLHRRRAAAQPPSRARTASAPSRSQPPGVQTAPRSSSRCRDSVSVTRRTGQHLECFSYLCSSALICGHSLLLLRRVFLHRLPDHAPA